MRRSRMRALAVVVLTAAAASGLAVWRATQPRLVADADVVALVDGREIALAYGSSGVGLGGRLVLVADRCIGLEPVDGSEPRILLWPGGTSVHRDGERVVVESNGRRFTVGERLDAGSEQRTGLAGLEDLLPEPCRGHDIVDVALP